MAPRPRPIPTSQTPSEDPILEEVVADELYDEYMQTQLDEYLQISKGLENIRYASEMEPVQVIRSVFTSLNRASQVGGIPFRCMHVYHGPKHGGKTLLAMADVISYTNNGHLAVWIDSERTFSPKFFADCGGDPSKVMVTRPKTYEECMNTVTAIIDNFIKGKNNGSIRKETAIIFVIDTINKLLPKNMMAEVTKEDDLVRQLRIMGMTKAMINQCWMDQLTPIVGDNDIAFVLIAQERKRSVEEAMAKVGHRGKRGGQRVEVDVSEDDFKVKGGDAILFDNSFQVRISLSSLIREKVGDEEIIVGKRHRGIVLKNKVGFPDEVFYFFTSNGKGNIPVGLDYVREVVEECRQRGWLKTSGAWISIVLPGDVDSEDSEVAIAKGQGQHGLVNFLRENREIYQVIVDALNER